MHEISGIDKRQHRFKSLLQNSEYRVRVRSVNMMGNSEWTEWTLVKTKMRDVSKQISIPFNLTTEAMDTKTFRAKWSIKQKKDKERSKSEVRIKYHVFVDCDDGVGFHEVHAVEGVQEAVLRNVASTSGIVRCRIQANNLLSGVRSPFSTISQVQLFSLRRQRRKSTCSSVSTSTKEEAQIRARDAAARIDIQRKGATNSTKERKSTKAVLKQKYRWAKTKKMAWKALPIVVMVAGLTIFLVLILLSGNPPTDLPVSPLSTDKK